MLILWNLSFQVLICRTCWTLFCHITFNKLELPHLIIEYKDKKSCQVSILPNSFGGIYLVLARAAFREGCFSWWTEFWIWRSGMWLNSIFWIDNCLLFFFNLASGQNPPNPAIWFVLRVGSFLWSCPLTWAESLAASFTSLFVVCEWAKPVIFNHFSFKTCAIISIS